MALTATEIVEQILDSNPIPSTAKPHEIIKNYYEIYKTTYATGNSMNGLIFERLLLLVLKRENITPIYYQAKMSFIPNIDFDILLYNELCPIIISAKTSLRERWKQADLEGLALKNVHRKAKCYVVTLSESEVATRRKTSNDYVGIDSFILAAKPEFDEWLEEIKSYHFSIAGSVPVIANQNEIIK